MEHRLAGEQTTDPYAVQPPDEFVVPVDRVDLDRVRPSQFMQAQIGVDEWLIDPPARPVGIATSAHDVAESSVHPHLEPSDATPQRSRYPQPVEWYHRPRIG